MITEYTVRSDWDTEGERFTVLYRNRVVIITRSRRIVREWFPQMWMDTRSIPDIVLLQCIGPAVKVCVYVCTQWKMLSKCDLLTPGLLVEAAAQAVGDKWVWFSVTKCNKVWKSVTI